MRIHRRLDLPVYQCHRRVGACRIAQLAQDSTGQWIVTPTELHLDPFAVPREYVLRQNPVAGGYLIQYADGNLTFSPAEHFEGVHTLANALEGRRIELEAQLDAIYAALAHTKENPCP